MNVREKLLPVLCVALLISCLSPYEGETVDPEEGPVEETTDLFQPTGGEGSEIRIRFYTNDTKYRRATGYTLWTHKAYTFDENPSVTVSKPLGSAVAGYGMVLYSKLRTVNNVEKLVFLTLMINNDGEYTVGKVIDASYTTVVPWTPSGNLKKGRGLENQIAILHDGNSKNTYNIRFNGANEAYFEDGEEPYCEGSGRSGYVVVISPTDLNNAGAVEVLFSEGAAP